MNIHVPQNFIPRDYQLDLFKAMDSGYKRAMCLWHRRAGKDRACLAYMIKCAAQRPGIYYYFLPNYQQGRKIIWEGRTKEGEPFLSCLPKELIARQDNKEMLIELTNGSIFRVIGTDNIDTIVGTNPIGVVFSEYAILNPVAWDFIRPILAENDGWAIFNSTPRGRNHLYHLDKKVANSKDWYRSELQTLWPELPNYSGIVSEEAIEAERDTGMEEDMIKQEFGVCYTAGIKGSYYSDMILKARKEKRIGKFPPSDHLWVDTFWDLGIDDDTAVWFRQMEGKKVLWVDYYQANAQPLAHYIQVLREKGYNYRTHYLPHDGSHRNIQTGITTSEMFRDLCESAGISDDVEVTSRYSIQEGINAVRARFSLFHFNEDLVEEAIDMLSLYHRKFDPRRNTFVQHPAHDQNSHCADAIRTEAVAEEMLYGSKHDSPDAPNIITSYDVFT